MQDKVCPKDYYILFLLTLAFEWYTMFSHRLWPHFLIGTDSHSFNPLKGLRVKLWAPRWARPPQSRPASTDWSQVSAGPWLALGLLILF